MSAVFVYQQKIYFYIQENRQTFLDILSLAVLIWISHFSFSHNFGVYEDDITFVVFPMKWWFTDFLNSVNFLISWPLGKPLHYFIASAISYVGNKIGGLYFLYQIAFLIIIVNSSLFYILIRKISNRSVAIMGAILFGLYPADTTQLFLTHAFGEQPALSFLLLGLIFYIKNKRWLSWVFAILTILTFETPFFVFFVAPLLNKNWNKKLLKSFYTNATVLILILLLVFVFRIYTGDGRVISLISGSNYTDIAQNTISNLFLGPYTSLSAFWGFISRINFSSKRVLVSMVLAIPILLVVFRKKGLGFCCVEAGQNGCIPNVEFKIQNNKYPWNLLIIGLVFLMISYLGSFTYYPAIALLGRATRVHIAGTLGGSFLVSILVYIVLGIFKDLKFRKYIAQVVFLSYLVLLVGYRVSIQEEYIRANEIQKWFWSNLVQLIPDAGKDTLIIVPNGKIPQTGAIFANSWADLYYLENIFQYKNVYPPPRVFSMELDGLNRKIIMDENHPYIHVHGIRDKFYLINENIIFIDYEDGVLVSFHCETR